MATTTINYLSLTGLQNYDAKIKEFIVSKVNEGDEKSFKYVNLVDGVLKFYTVNPIADDTTADFEIELPEQDLSNLMQLVKDATSGNVASFGDGGQVVDSGIKAADIATKTEVANVQTAVDNLDTYIGDIPEGYTESTIVAYINKKAEETLNSASGGSSESAASVLATLNTYKAENDAKVTANTDAIAVLNGDTTIEGSVDKKVTDAINEFATQISDDGTINTYKEILNYISTHGGEANEMMAAIDALEVLVGDKAVATQISEAIAAENLDQYATDEELAAAIARIVVVEGKAHEHGNATVLDGITAEKVAAWDASESNSKAYTDEKVAAVNATIGTVDEGKTVMQLLTEAREAAITSAKEYTDTEVAKVAATVTTLSQTHATDKATLEAKDTEIAGNVATLTEKVAVLESVEHVEITTEQIDELFA